jgi:rubredoxin
MAEAAYRSAILGAGKNQKSLTVGWEVLGLTKEVATRMFEEEAKLGFLSDREKMYGGQSRRYDSKGNQIDKEGNYKDAAAQKAAEEEVEKDEPASNVYECSECGFTLFIAKGREFKFYGEDFECPECGAGKDKFNARDLDSE